MHNPAQVEQTGKSKGPGEPVYETFKFKSPTAQDARQTKHEASAPVSVAKLVGP